jgi:ribosome-associated protein
MPLAGPALYRRSMRKAPPFPEASADLDHDGRPSKSALKRQMHDLQALGEALVTLPASRCEPLNLPEPLQDALAEYRRTRSHEGRRRQMQFIGKLMRQVDPEPIRQAVAAFRLGGAQDALALHAAERWREELLTDDGAVKRWLDEHPDTDSQRLRSLVRSARQDARADLPDGQPRHGRAYRELFQLVKAALSSADEADDLEADVDD